MGEEDMEDMATEVMEAMDMDVDTMARETQMLSQLLKLMLNQDICPEDMVMEVMDMVVMATDVDMEDMDMAVDTMARGRLKLSLVILEVTVVMAIAVDIMVRGRLEPSQATSEDMVGMVVGMDMGVM